MRLNALQLRQLEEERAKGVIRKIKRNPLYFILEDIYDTYNIGGLFRLADALAVEKMYLVGETETPPNSRIKKASIGTYKVVPWEYFKDTKEAIESITCNVERIMHKNNYKNKQDNKKTFHVTRYTLHVVAIEQHKNSIPYNKANYQFPLALIFGNESFGIKEETLKLAHQIVEIPMYGINKSLNVIVAASIVSYYAINFLTKK
jgi:23S rRNA (guanosine2251-2'-O)-methyltransferase